MAKLATEAELRALRAQINPHFLFNALTTLGYLIQTAPERALQTLLRLTSLLRAVLRSEGEHTTLGRELEVVESYLDIERARFEHRLRVAIDVPASLRGVRVPPLILQPVVENAVKHGISPQRLGGEVTVRARAEPAPGTPGATELVLVIEDTGAGASTATLAHGRPRRRPRQRRAPPAGQHGGASRSSGRGFKRGQPWKSACRSRSGWAPTASGARSRGDRPPARRDRGR